MEKVLDYPKNLEEEAFAYAKATVINTDMDIQYLKSVAKYILSAVLSVILIVYLLYHMLGGFAPDIETTAAELTTRQQALTVHARIMRNETVLFSKNSGDINYLFADGEKVAINAAVADVFPGFGSPEIRKQIIALEKKIKLLQDSNMSDAEKRTDTTSTDKLIWKNMYSVIVAADEGNVSLAASRSSDLLIQMNRRKIITKSVSNYNSRITGLQAQKQLLSTRLTGEEDRVITNSVGYFFIAVDGYENIFSSADIDKITYSEYCKKLTLEPESYAGKGTPIGKIVTDYIWYIACEVETASLHNYEAGKYYNVKFPVNADTSVSMYLYRILSDVGSQTSVLIFRTGVLPQDFNYLRNQTVQIIQTSYTGYRIPTSAVRIVNGKQGVYILNGSEVKFKLIEPLFEYDGFLIVKERDQTAADKSDWLGQNDSVIVKGKDLYDGKVVN